MTPRTRSSSCASLKKRGSLKESRSHEHDLNLEETDDDEKMVEDLLYPSSPAASNSATPHFFPIHPLHSVTSPSPSSDSLRYSAASSTSVLGAQMEFSPSNSSVFATTDPFYLQQLQAAQRSSASTFFASAGRPSPQSPFVLAEQPTSSSSHAFVHRMPVSPEAEPHHLFAW